MSLDQIYLDTYDNVVAVTQAAINQTLHTYLLPANTQLDLYYTVDQDYNYVPTDPDNAIYIFNGTLGYPLDQNGDPVEVDGKPINYVTLQTPQGNQTVRYSILFSEAEFQITSPPGQWSQQPGQPWIFNYNVQLALQETALEDLPESIQEQIEQQVMNLGPGMYSIQQLLLDLTTAQFDTAAGTSLPGLPEQPTSILQSILADALQSEQESGSLQPLLGIAVTVPENPTAPPPTFMPTALNFCVTGYDPPNPNDLDTLNYLVMTNNDPMPSGVPASFGFPWVTDSSQQGAMAIKEGLYAPLLIEQLNPILKGLCPVVYVEADAHEPSPEEQTIQLNPGSDHAFIMQSPPENGTIAYYTYNSSASDDDAAGSYYATVSASYDMSCSVVVTGDLVELSGSCSASASSRTQRGKTNLSECMPTTKYSWSVQFRLEVDLEQPGQLDFVLQNPNFDAAPVVDENDADCPTNQSFWQSVVDGLAGTYSTLNTSLGDLTGQVEAAINDVLPNIQDLYEGANQFILPGADTFVFSNPTFTDSSDLASNITYLTPQS